MTSYSKKAQKIPNQNKLQNCNPNLTMVDLFIDLLYPKPYMYKPATQPSCQNEEISKLYLNSGHKGLKDKKR